MKRTILFLLAATTALSCLFAQATKNPFSKMGYKKHITYTSSKGEFEEFHKNADVVEIGSVYFNTKTNKVVGYVNEEKENAEVATATSAMSVDPLCEKYYWITPYAYCLNNPVKYIDPDGKQVFLGLNTPFSPLLSVSDPILMANKPVVTETMSRVGRTTTETSSTGGRSINIERVNAGRHAETEQLQKLGMEKNTESFTRVDPKTGKDVTTIPDGFKNGQTTEIKNLGQGQKQSLTEQLRAQKELSNENGTNPRLHINKEAGLTKPLQNAGFDITQYSIVPPAPNNNTQTQKPVWQLIDKKK